jgi:hypothetical protein
VSSSRINSAKTGVKDGRILLALWMRKEQRERILDGQGTDISEGRKDQEVGDIGRFYAS